MQFNPHDLELWRTISKDPDVLCLLELDPEDPELSEEARKLLKLLQLVRQGVCSKYEGLSDASGPDEQQEACLNPYELFRKV